MTANTPPYVQQSGSHSAQLVRQAISSILTPAGGIVEAGDYLVTQNGTPNMTVNVAGGVPGGRIWVPGTSSVGVQGQYYCFNDATVNLAIAASNPTNPRIDIAVAQVQDAAYAGAVNSFQLAIVTGTPAGSPVAPSTPASSLKLANIAVAANATTVVTGNITDTRIKLGTAIGGGAVVTSLPGSPSDGQECFFLADSTNGIVWHLKYRSASGSAFKWEHVGGGPLYNEIVTTELTASSTYVALTTAGPNIALPLAGDYLVTHGALMTSGASNTEAKMSYDIGGTGAVDADKASAIQGAAASFSPMAVNVMRTRRKTGLTAVTLTSKYACVNPSNATFQNRFLSAVPVRVG